MRQVLLIVSLFLIFTGSVCAQVSAAEIDLVRPDLKKLEWLTHQAVNDLREEKKSQALPWDDVLYRAAKDHADFLLHEKKLSHYQKTKGRHTPAERVKLHGGSIYAATGENVVAITVGILYPFRGTKVSTVTYEASAIHMATVWKHSPGHYSNIMSPKFNCTALAASYDPATQRLVAVQVFGFTDTPAKANELPDYSSQLLDAAVPDLPFGLRKSNDFDKKDQKINAKFLKLSMERGYLTGSFKSAKRIFKGKRSGITQEFIPLSQFDSTSLEFTQVPNRRNGLYELNGPISKPVYRREMLRFSRKNTIRDYIIDLKLGRKRLRLIKKKTVQFIYPLHPNDSQTAYNLFLIRKKSLKVSRTYLNYPARLFDMEFPALNYKNSLKAKANTDRYRITHQFDTAALQMYYPSRQVEMDPSRQRYIMNTFAGINGKVVLVEAEAFASIEGEEKTNDQLARSRMAYFMSLIQPYLDTVSVEPKIVAREQWELFREQIRTNNLTDLSNMSNDAARTYVNQHSKDSVLAGLLDAQRYIRVRLVWRKDFSEVIRGKSAREEYNALKRSFDLTSKPKPKLVNDFEKAQLAMYYELSLADTVTYIPDVPQLTRYPVFRYHDLIFQYAVLHRISDREFYDQLHALAREKYFPSHIRQQAVYNNLVLIYQYFVTNRLDSLMNTSLLFCDRYRQSVFFLKKIRKITCREKEDDVMLFPDEYWVLREIPALIRAGQGQKLANFPVNPLLKYHYLYTIHSLYPFIPLHPDINSILPKFKEQFHPDNSVLSDEERLKLAYFYNAMKRPETARELLKPLAMRDEPNKEALKIYLTLIIGDFKDLHAFSEQLIREFPRLGKEEWCDLWVNPGYLNFLLLEDLKLKNFYNCHCER